MAAGVAPGVDAGVTAGVASVERVALEKGPASSVVPGAECEAVVFDKLLGAPSEWPLAAVAPEAGSLDDLAADAAAVAKTLASTARTGGSGGSDEIEDVAAARDGGDDRGGVAATVATGRRALNPPPLRRAPPRDGVRGGAESSRSSARFSSP